MAHQARFATAAAGAVLYLARRLADLAVVLLLLSVGIFLILNVLPGDVARITLGQYATPQDLQAYREVLGLTRPAYVRFGEWLFGFVTGDWGSSLLYKMPIRVLVQERAVRSLLLAGLALAIAVPMGIVLGGAAALRKNTLLDRLLSAAMMVFISIPEYLTGTLLILVLAYSLRLLPATSMTEPTDSLATVWPRLVMPILTLMVALLPHIVVMTRAGLIGVLSEPYVKAARLRGISPWKIVVKYTLRKALLPTIGVISINVGYLLGGIVVVETVFSYPGLGGLLVNAVNNRDIPVVQTAVLLVAIGYSAATLVADLVYVLLDPRIRYW